MNKLIKISKSEANIIFWYIIFFLTLGLFMSFSLTRIQQPIAQDELHWLVAAETFYTNGIPRRYSHPGIADYSPHLYLHSIVLAFRLFGKSETIARLPGVMFVLLAIIMVFFITKSFSQGNRIERIQLATLSSLLCATSPAIIQASIIIDIDNTILIPAVLFLYWAFVKYQQNGDKKWAILIVLAVAVTLWGRVTTPIIIVFLLFFYILVSKSELKRKIISIIAIFSGALLFVVSWYVYCGATNVSFLAPFNYTMIRISHQYYTHDLTFSQILLSLFSLTLWLGILSSLLFIVICWLTIQRYKRQLKNSEIRLEDIFLWSGVIIVLCYTLMEGVNFGYPKYQIPGIPLLYIFICLTLSHYGVNFVNVRLRGFFILLIVACVVQIFIGDFIYILRYTLRNAIAFMSPSYPILEALLLKIGILLVVFVIMFVICLRSLPKKAWLLVLILFSVSTNIGTAFLQSTANYSTGYNYGVQGTIESTQYIRKKVPLHSSVLAPDEIIYYLKLPKSPYLCSTLWTNVDELRKRLADKNTSALVYSIATNTVLQVQTMSTNKAIQNVLHQDFAQTKIGSYIIWVRKYY